MSGKDATMSAKGRNDETMSAKGGTMSDHERHGPLRINFPGASRPSVSAAHKFPERLPA